MARHGWRGTGGAARVSRHGWRGTGGAARSGVRLRGPKAEAASPKRDSNWAARDSHDRRDRKRSASAPERVRLPPGPRGEGRPREGPLGLRAGRLSPARRRQPGAGGRASSARQEGVGFLDGAVGAVSLDTGAKVRFLASARAGDRPPHNPTPHNPAPRGGAERGQHDAGRHSPAQPGAARARQGRQRETRGAGASPGREPANPGAGATRPARENPARHEQAPGTG